MRIAKINLIFRFILELSSFVAVGYWAYNLAEGLLGGTLALLVPLGLALVWGTFGVREDPSRTTPAPVHIPGALRLVIELLFFSFAVWSLFAVGLQLAGWILLGCLVVHHLLAYRRLAWLVRQMPEKKPLTKSK